MFEADMTNRKLHMDLQLEPSLDEDFQVYGDASRLSQIIINLLSNAIKFTPPEGTIKITMNIVSDTEKEVILRITIADTGVGMEPAEKEKLFNRFAQANTRTYAEYGGSGLGLFITKVILVICTVFNNLRILLRLWEVVSLYRVRKTKELCSLLL